MRLYQAKQINVGNCQGLADVRDTDLGKRERFLGHDGGLPDLRKGDHERVRLGSALPLVYK